AAFPAAATYLQPHCSTPRPRPSCHFRKRKQNSRRRALPKTSASSPIAAAASRRRSIYSCSTGSATTSSRSTTARWANGPRIRRCRSKRVRLSPRHCERSEAIHLATRAEAWIASSLSLLAMTEASRRQVRIRDDLRIRLVHEIEPRNDQQRRDTEGDGQRIMQDEIAGGDAEQRRHEGER